MATAAKPTTIRVDENLKAQANEILGSVGLSYNTYVVMATHQLVNQCRIPFEIVPAGGSRTRRPAAPWSPRRRRSSASSPTTRLPLTISTDSWRSSRRSSRVRDQGRVGLQGGLRSRHETAPPLEGEFKEAVSELMRTGAVSDEYGPHELSNPGENYNAHRLSPLGRRGRCRGALNAP